MISVKNFPTAENQVIEAVKDMQNKGEYGSRVSLVQYQSDADLRILHHGFSGAIRSFKFLSQEISKNLDPNIPTDRRKLEVLSENLSLLLKIRAEIIEPILPLE